MKTPSPPRGGIPTRTSGEKNNTPLAYISGRQEFYGLNFLVNKHTLIPRPDTIVMVDEAIQIPNTKYQIPNTILIDIGTGTGCIPISIIKNLKNKNVKVIATDISRAALRVAEKNAKNHGVKINFLHGNLLEPILKNKYQILNTKYQILLTANLPYLTAEQFKSEPSIQSEPRVALVGGGRDGLKLYEKLLTQIKFIISNNEYLNIFVLLEIDPRQSDAAKKLVQKYLPNFSCEIKKDLAGRDRLVVCSI